MPILGIYASAISGNLAFPSYESIATSTVGSGGASSITFSSIPSTYTHLQIRAISISGTSGNRVMQVGSTGSVDTGSNYGMHEFYGGGATVTSGSILSNSDTQLFYSPPDSTIPALSVTDILDYTNTNKISVFRTLGGGDLNGSGRITFASGYWNNTAAINTIKIFPSSGSFAQYSQFALYGIKG